MPGERRHAAVRGNIGYLWHLRRDRADATEVEIRSVRRGDVATRIEIEHRGWERLGAGGQDWRDRNRAGWETLLPHYSGKPTPVAASCS